MKKLFLIVALGICLINCKAFAKSLDERIASVENRYEQRIEKIDTMRGREERKEVLKRHAREDADLKIQHLKDLDAVKASRKSKKAE